MSVNVAFNNVTYAIPNVAGESGWSSLTDYLVALATNAATQGALRQAIRVALTSPVTVTGSDMTIVTDLTAPGAVALTLPTGVAKQIYIVVDGKGDAATNPITVSTTGGQLINGAATYVMNIARGGVMMQFDGTQWRVLAAFYGSSPSFASATFTNITVTSTATVGNMNANSVNVGVEAVTTPANTQTFTNKTYNAEGVGNALSNVKDSNIKALAAIARSKLAAGTISHVVINAASDGAFSSEAALAKVRGGTGADNTSVTFPASGTLVTQTATESLTNKTLNDTSNVILKGGNTTGSPLFIGTNDNNQLVLETDGISRMQFFNTAALTSGDAAFAGNAGLALPTGTTAQRPSGALSGTVRLNSESNEFEGFANSAWQAIGGGVNEQPLKNYLKSWATAAVAPGTLSTLASGIANLVSLTAFYADSTSGAAGLTQPSSTALRGNFNFLSALSLADAAGGRFFQFPAFALEAADLGKPVSISFDLTGNTLDNDWDVVVVRYNASGVHQELISVAGNASTTTATPSAKLPTGTVQFRGFFVATADVGHLYALRYRRRSGSVQVRVDTLYVGPQTQLLGAAITDFQSSTPSTTGWTNTTASLRSRRVGNALHCRLSLSFTGAPTSPSGNLRMTTSELFTGLGSLTIDTTGAVNSHVCSGTWEASDTGVAAYAGGMVKIRTDGFVIFQTTTTEMTATVPFTFGTGDSITGEFQVPISGWSSNITLGERALEEYASNSSTTDTTDTTSFANGIAGSPTPGTLLAFRTKRVRFQTPIQATDALFVEIQVAGGAWRVLSGVDGATGVTALQLQNGSDYGIGLQTTLVNSTDVNVGFGRYGYASGLYGAVGIDWGSLSSIRWRVRKVSSGAAIGGAIGARNVVGDVSGTAVPAGYLGELIEATRITDVTLSTTAGTITDITGLSVSLTPGVWEVESGGQVYINGATGTAPNGRYVAWLITDASNVVQRSVLSGLANAGNATTYISPYVKIRLLVTATTVYKTRAVTSENSAATTVSQAIAVAGSTVPLYLRAVRIA